MIRTLPGYTACAQREMGACAQNEMGKCRRMKRVGEQHYVKVTGDGILHLSFSLIIIDSKGVSSHYAVFAF